MRSRRLPTVATTTQVNSPPATPATALSTLISACRRLTPAGWYAAEGVTAVKRTVPDSPTRLNADCRLGNEAKRRVGEARNAAMALAQSFPKATPLYIQPQAVTASWRGFLISPVSKRYLYCCPRVSSSVKPYAAPNSIDFV